ncbi:MAG: outer membrane lipoprotein-sorting protein [candidate division KSB1 bacterium]|nr:outer membrane lipoprotein-sorting protein [candidate division KSB1 bacterium]MDZ7301914.1 outer membrane lipoprotein-sorting protein [candidate division KSB1 bacterium]MDZ7314255.1 outer membrane lipoprotein-sorting protein [candidate division KSB1 bacterium]
MKLIYLPFAFCFLPFAVAAQTAQEIVEKSDAARNLTQPFKMAVRLTSFENEKQKDQADFEVLVSGRDKALVKFVSGRDKGNYLLMVGEDMWIYIPNTRKPIRITPIQRLMGEASNGDVARTNYSQDYDATLLGEDALNGSACWKLELQAKSKGATYHRIEFWVEKGTYLPKRADFYLISGKFYKTALFEKFEKNAFADRFLTRTVLLDQLRPGRKTVMEYFEVRPEKIPDKYFNKNYLPSLR